MLAHMELLRKVPSFPNYTPKMWGYPERTLEQGEASLVVLGPPLHLYHFLPSKNCTVHVSGIPGTKFCALVKFIFSLMRNI